MDKVQEIWQASQPANAAIKDEFRVLLKRDLTDQESLMRTFGIDKNNDADGKSQKKSSEEGKSQEGQEKSEDEEEKIIELDMKKNFYYVIGPSTEVVDCAKIYSFLHEDNIFKRITARVAKHADSKIMLVGEQ